MSFLLLVLNASALCVARTDICAPPNSTLTGQIADQGGQVEVTPSAPMKALGAEFRAGAPLFVHVTPWWSSDKTRGVIVTVRGVLTRPSVISGVTVAGAVEIGQLVGRPSRPQLTVASEFTAGKLQVFSAGTVDVGPGTRLTGNVDTGGGRIDISSPQPIHGFGLDFTAGTVRVEQRTNEATITGQLARPQEVGGILVDKQVVVILASGAAQLRVATVVRDTPLERFGLLKGSAPAGTTIGTLLGSGSLGGPGPFTVCGVAMTAPPTSPSAPGSFVTLTKEGNDRVVVRGTLVGPDVEVQRGVHLTGVFAATYDRACQLQSIEGTLARDSEAEGVKLAARTAIATGRLDKERFVRGTLAAPMTIDGLRLAGAATIRVTTAGALHLFDGALAAAAPFEQWQLPAGTRVQRSSDDTWSFEVPRNKAANAIAEHRGQRVERVTAASSDGTSTTFTLARPHRIAGTTIALENVGIDHQTGCVTGGTRSAQRSGIFSIPAGGSATVCGGVIASAEGTYAVPSLRVGSWYATSAVAGDAGSSPPQEGTPRAAAPSGPLAGYWIQINSLCKAPSGIPTPPPPQRWIWVDRKGQATAENDRLVLAGSAAKAGKPCPVYPCCVP